MTPEALQLFKEFLNPRPKWAVVLGSGLSNLVPQKIIASLPFEALPGMPVSKVAGHRGRFVLAELQDHIVLYQQGRLHLYENFTASTVTLPIRLMAESEIYHIILTNAAGSLRENLLPGNILHIKDHINLQGQNPLIGLGLNNPFIDMSNVWQTWSSPDLMSGIYAGVLGPGYETPAEVRYLRQIGADAVGMSTVQEAILAHAYGMQIYGFSLITNFAGNIGKHPLSHKEVLKMGKLTGSRLGNIIKQIVMGD